MPRFRQGEVCGCRTLYVNLLQNVALQSELAYTLSNGHEITHATRKLQWKCLSGVFTIGYAWRARGCKVLWQWVSLENVKQVGWLFWNSWTNKMLYTCTGKPGKREKLLQPVWIPFSTPQQGICIEKLIAWTDRLQHFRDQHVVVCLRSDEGSCCVILFNSTSSWIMLCWPKQCPNSCDGKPYSNKK